jgi:hypothetical protein
VFFVGLVTRHPRSLPWLVAPDWALIQDSKTKAKLQLDYESYLLTLFMWSIAKIAKTTYITFHANKPPLHQSQSTHPQRPLRRSNSVITHKRTPHPPGLVRFKDWGQGLGPNQGKPIFESVL